MVAFKLIAIAACSAIAAQAAPILGNSETGLLGGLPPVNLPVTDIVDAVGDSLQGTPLQVVGETLQPDVSVGALDPATGTAQVGVDGAGLLEGVDVDVDASGAERRAVNIDLGGSGISLKRAVNVDLGGAGLSFKRAVAVDLGGLGTTL